MTPLPQRKKTAEEIAKLRDHLGVPPGVESDPAEAASPQAKPGSLAASGPEAKPRFVSKPRFEPKPPVGAKAPTEEIAQSSVQDQPAPSEGAPSPELAGIPTRRHSAEELEEIQRRDMLSQINPPTQTNFKFQGAHPALIIFGYLLATAGSCIFWLDSFPWPGVPGCSVGALMIAGFLALRRPVSRHHAGFISAIAVLVGAFATIHHFPELQHAS